MPSLPPPISPRRPLRRPAVREAALYDFRDAVQLSPDQMRALSHQAGALAAIVSRTLQAYLDADVSFSLHSMETVACSQYIAALPENVIAGVMAFGGGMPSGIWQVPAPLALVAVDCMLGGRGAAVADDTTEFTPVQAAVLLRFLEDIVSAWTVAWESLAELDPHVERIVTGGAVAAAMGHVESQIVHMQLAVRIAAAQGTMNVALPISVMQRVLREGQGETLHRRESSHHRITSTPLGGHTRRFACEVRVVVPGPPMTLRRLLTLHPGDTVDLQCPADEPFTVMVGGREKFLATPGVSRGMVAARLARPLS
jgi:flagellar motor switch protein FliM